MQRWNGPNLNFGTVELALKFKAIKEEKKKQQAQFTFTTSTTPTTAEQRVAPRRAATTAYLSLKCIIKPFFVVVGAAASFCFYNKHPNDLSNNT